MPARINIIPEKKRLSITTILLLTNVLVFVLQLILPDFFNKLTLRAGYTLVQPWTIFTSMFMHGSFSHLLFNMYALLIFGSLIEQRIGRKRFLWSYFLAGIVAALSFDVYNVILGNIGQGALGASGAIMGILGLTIMLLPKMRVAFFFVIPMSMRTAGIIFALMDLFGMFNPSSGIAHIAHLGGLAVGLILGYYFVKKKIGFQKRFVNITITPTKPKPKETDPNYDKAIELTKDDVDNYFKYGKL